MDFKESTNIDCTICKHRWFWSCDAFPEGIPIEILSGEKKHDKPLENQKNSIIFDEI